METLFSPIISEDTSAVSMEKVQIAKQEYKYLTSYLRTRGLNLYCWNPMARELTKVEIKRSDTIHIVAIDGVLMPIDHEMEKSIVDPRCYFFEALNYHNAEKRVIKWQQGEIKELCNLVKPSKDGIKFW